jgi:hypothetical protein
MPYDVESPTLRIWREILESAELLIASSHATLDDPKADVMMRTIAQSNLAFAEQQAARARAALGSEAEQ